MAAVQANYNLSNEIIAENAYGEHDTDQEKLLPPEIFSRENIDKAYNLSQL
jgi:hypothetical protein